MDGPERSHNESESVILVKAAPQVGTRNGETICCAGLTPDLQWVRLYPVRFRRLDDAKKFGRWDRVRYEWRKPTDDPRPESRRISEDSLHIVGELKRSERNAFIERAVVRSLRKERSEGRSLALIKPEILDFTIAPKAIGDLTEEQAKFDAVQRQADLFAKSIEAYKPCPYKFQYRYRIEDGERTGTCQDWEIEATFFRHSMMYGEQKALAFIQKTFGEVYPRKGMLFAMGTHSLYPDTWLLNGVLRYDEPDQISLF